ncbi:MAG TPA: prepilin peptidase [Propionibacteriaceae bacterium]|nr:prepilin peptidase [Propionibacteriaceae bacterium]
MIRDGLVAAAIAMVIATTTGLLVRPLLRLLPGPVPGDGRPIYRDLGSTRFLLVCGGLAGIAAAVSWLSLPRYAQPMWSVLAILGVLLAAIDARTSWLPLQLTRIAWLAMALAALLAAPLGGGVWVSVRSAAGAAIAGGLYLLVWLISRGGFGFGDVRFAPLLGAAAAADSWTLLWWALLLGTLVGGLVGVARLALGQREAFPYAPSMLAGAYAACVISLIS